MALPEEQFLHTYTYQLLRNVEAQTLVPLFKQSVEGGARLFRETGGTSSWDKVVHILNMQLHYHQYDDSDFDSTLFEHILWNQDHVYLLKMQSELSVDEAFQRIAHSPAVNRKLRVITRTDELISSIRKQGNRVMIFFKMGVAYLGRNRDQCTFYVPCVLDFENGFVQIRIKESLCGKSGVKLKNILETVQMYINNHLNMEVTVSFYNPTYLHTMLYNMFTNESAKAERILKEHINGYVDDEVICEISTFLEGKLSIGQPEKYIDRVKSILLQHTSENLTLGEFYNGFIFGFTFFDKNFIKSLTRDPSRQPIYNAPVYWNLKDLIHDERVVKQLSVYWRFDKDDFEAVPGEDFEFVEISLEEIYNCIEIHFYNKQHQKRGLKERYVLRKIIENLPR
ncbi:hypothetical protein [Paenibacillus oleatilyticus]|uniref:Uncharacterized protein n=1 Tax=Paenibacillus oleatilyticus TaxID=2594886 RepID=A0ABV4UZY0_9BACL